MVMVMSIDNQVLTYRDRCPDRVHDHAWETESAHRTSLGLLRYVHCHSCGTRRVDLQPHPERPPAALSVAVPPPVVADQRRAGGRVLRGSARK